MAAAGQAWHPDSGEGAWRLASQGAYLDSRPHQAAVAHLLSPAIDAFRPADESPHGSHQQPYQAWRRSEERQACQAIPGTLRTPELSHPVVDPRDGGPQVAGCRCCRCCRVVAD